MKRLTDAGVRQSVFLALPFFRAGPLVFVERSQKILFVFPAAKSIILVKPRRIPVASHNDRQPLPDLPNVTSAHVLDEARDAPHLDDPAR